MGVVATPHDGLLVDEVIHDMTANLLVQRPQARVEKDAAKGTDVLTGDIEEVECPFLELLACQLAAEDASVETRSEEWLLVLALDVDAQILHENVSRYHGDRRFARRPLYFSLR